jgi:putative PEP-CTERM system histidine kinase
MVRIVLFAGAIFALAVLMVSATIRARVRVFLMKTFFQYKYDYRNEWLRFIGTLSESSLDNVATSAVRAVAQIVNSPGGVVWVREQDGKNYLPVGTWESDIPVMSSVDQKSSLVRFLKGRQWVIDLREMREQPARYEGLELEPWLLGHEDWWLVVPLMLGESLFGFMILETPGIAPTLNFEDHDLLRTVGRHVATVGGEQPVRRLQSIDGVLDARPEQSNRATVAGGQERGEVPAQPGFRGRCDRYNCAFGVAYAAVDGTVFESE